MLEGDNAGPHSRLTAEALATLKAALTLVKSDTRSHALPRLSGVAIGHSIGLAGNRSASGRPCQEERT
jgi:hypothetical protein